ncbi:MAG: saccharopine dehydrogenase, partial [Paracoccaceae bacterium]
MTIHWCGTGLSSIPGLRHLIETEGDVVVWNRSVDKAKAAVGDIAKDIRAFDMAALTEATKKGDVV